MVVDFYNFYQTTFLYNLYLKFCFLKNFYIFPKLLMLFLFFCIRKLEFLEDPRIFNYVYLFRFFFGRRAQVLNYDSFFNLGRYYFNFDVGLCYLAFLTMFLPLNFLIFELQPFLNLPLTRQFYFRSPKCFIWTLWDTTIFTEKKTNVGLFDLKDAFYYKFIFKGTGDRGFFLPFFILKSLKISFN